MDSCYSSLAFVYDEMMSYVPYDNWIENIANLTTSLFKGNKPSIFEIGGGTGTLGARLAYEGYQYQGSDYSSSMCEVAWGKGLDMICCDCRALATTATFDLVLFLFDGINYLTTLEDYTKTFIEVSQILTSQGYFLFDITTEANSLGNFDDYYEAESFDKGAYIRHSYYEKENHRQVNNFDIFVQHSDAPSTYSRISEQHCQTLFTVNDILEAIPQDLFSVEGVWDGFTQFPANNQSERVHFLLKRRV